MSPGLAGCDDSVDEPETLFTLAVIADPHITGSAEREDRLAEVVAAINAGASTRDIELVAVLGDIGWSGELATARGLLDQLTVPYLPLIGDNEFHAGEEATFATTFEPIFTELASSLEGWRKAPAPVANPETGRDSWFQNFAFEYRGVHIVAVDWSARSSGSGEFGGDVGYLHDFAGGSLAWFESELAGLAGVEPDSVILLSHIPMHEAALAFQADSALALAEVLAPYGAEIWANIAGHLHINYEAEGAGFEVWATAAPWSSYEPVRLIEVARDGDQLVYSQELLYIPY